MSKDAKKKAIAKKTGERFEKNPFAKKYKERNEGKEHARKADKSVPAYMRRDKNC